MPPATRTSRAKALAMAAVGILAAPACPRHSSLYQAEAQLGRGAIQRYSAQKNRAKVLLAVELRGAHRFAKRDDGVGDLHLHPAAGVHVPQVVQDTIQKELTRPHDDMLARLLHLSGDAGP